MSIEDTKVINDDKVERKEVQSKIQRIAADVLETWGWSPQIADKITSYIFNEFILIRKSRQDNYKDNEGGKNG